MYNSIQKHNKNSNAPIQFIHGGSSAALAFFGKTVSVRNDDGLVQKVIPNALIPNGILRKIYNIHPMSGERDVGVYWY